MREDERNFVIANWLRSYATSDWALMMTPKVDNAQPCQGCGRYRVMTERDDHGRINPQTGPAYWRGHAALVADLMARCNVSVLENEDGLLDGFICRDKHDPVLHYLYVRKSARGTGAARMLAADLVGQAVTYTHRSPWIRQDRVPPGWRFSLYEAFR
jgi:GNAT superfamily N-acetyltransferase